ncbi:MBOAT family O-acyltransferase [Candidatus Paracaedibacter symbiosus]|uniref:MBOAT family O-acyltransferase n=1 Tax=Candidatus Paracaedibacter symbiosus TaxID=244582 RepID=UPI0018DD3B44|nr:MBOAT family protein [Candidatus Paracaedibacter symbiosus]
MSVASLCFYAFWDGYYLILLSSSLITNYFCGLLISREKVKARKKHLLIFSLLLNLLVLFYYKYTNFFFLALSQENPFGKIILPLGISFFTFTQIAFLVDAYRGETKEFSFSRYLVFVTYFPHLIAGPILHHKDIIPQFISKMSHRVTKENIAVGLLVFAIGLFKKVIIADEIALYATPIFEQAKNHQVIGMGQAWVGALGYTFQLYFDFSGYSDMALGISRLFGINLPINFDSPYKSKNIIEFWRRWHMSLSRFLRDYVYIPLGGNRKGVFRRYVNLFLTMLIGGVWHGAGWTFIVWGILHGIFLCINHLWNSIKSKFIPNSKKSFLRDALAWAITFLCVVVAWVFFRADSFSTARYLLKAMVDISSLLTIETIEVKSILIILSLIFFCLLLPNTQEILASYRIGLQEKNLANLNLKKSQVIIQRYARKIVASGLTLRLATYLVVAHITLFTASVLFYTHAIDKWVYRILPVDKGIAEEISYIKGDFRSNLYSQPIFDGFEKKIIFVGSSYVTNIGFFTFKHDNNLYKSGTLGIRGNSLLNGFRTALAIMDTPNLTTIIFGVSPLGFGQIFIDDLCWPTQGLKWAYSHGRPFPLDYKTNHLQECGPQNLTIANLAQLYINPSNKIFFQWHEFVHKLQTINFNRLEILPEKFSSLQEIKEHKNKVLHNSLKDTYENPLLVEDQANGSDSNFHWLNRNCLESMESTGDVYVAFAILKQELDKRGIKLIVYETPTPSHKEAPHIYPKGFLEAYVQKATQMFSSLGIPYYDISRLFPWDGKFMSDFIHPQADKRKIVHQQILERVFEEK